MKLSKSQFCTYVDTYKEMLEQEDKILNVLGADCEWTPSNWINNYYNMLTDLCELPEDKIIGNFLDWFAFDTNFGKRDNIIFCDGRKWTINSPEILYDFIKEEDK